MSYRIETGEHPGHAAQRIACEQARDALAEICESGKPVGLRVHLLRKRCTRIRAVAKLVRPGFDEYESVNSTFRDTARRVTDHRDARIMHELVAELADGEHLASVPDCYRSRCRLAEEHASGVLAAVREILVRSVQDLERCDFGRITYEHVLHGFETTLVAAERSFANTSEFATDAEFHELRKHCKYHGLQLRLLEPLLDGDVRNRQMRVDQVYTLLGDAQDCSVLVHDIGAQPEYFRSHPDVGALRSAARRLARHRRRRALAHADELFTAADAGFVAAALADLRSLHARGRPACLMMAG